LGDSEVTSPRWRGARLQESMTCVGCGYELRGLQADAVCPECARPIKDTLAEIEALGPGGRQARWMLGSLSVLTVLSFVGFVCYVGIPMLFMFDNWPVPPRAVGGLIASVTSVAQVLVVLGILKTIRKHSRYSLLRLALEQPVQWALVTSIMKVAALVGQAVLWLAFTTMDDKIEVLVLGVLGISVTASMHGKMRMVVRLQEMTGHNNRAAAARLRSWGIPLTMGTMLVLMGVSGAFWILVVPVVVVVAISYWYLLAFGAVSLHRPLQGRVVAAE
jgi:hypothetical protein